MKTILHLSDLHFGKIHPPALAALEQFLKGLEKKLDLIIVSGDWTQRARRSQFREAADFIDRIQTPIVSVPGNHDIPLYDALRRMANPFSRYREFIKPRTLSEFSDNSVAIVGLNTVTRWRTVEGHISKKDIARAQKIFKEASPQALKIIITHHPLSRGQKHTKLRPKKLADELFELQPHLVLSGHYHRTVVEHIQRSNHKTLHLAAGSAISNRLRGGVNEFHLIETHQTEIHVTNYSLKEEGFLALKSTDIYKL